MRNKTVAVILGIVSILAGLFCLLNPAAGSLASTMIAGWSFLILGAFQLIIAFREIGWGARIWAILLGVIGILAGFNLLAHPLEGVLTLTLVLGILFVVSGVMKLIAGFALPSGSLKGLVIVSAIASAILGIMILADYPGTAVIALGILLGVELISDGATIIGLAFSERNAARG